MAPRRTAAAPIVALLAVLLTLVVMNAIWRARARHVGWVASPAPPGAEAADTAAARADPEAARALARAARAAVRARIAAESASTYLPETVAGADSAVRRWPERHGGTLTLALVRTQAPGFQGEFLDAARWAASDWNGVGLPVRFDERADTAGADVVVVWADTIDAERAGRADVTWDGRGAIVKVRIVLAIHLSGGRAITPRQMVTMALHELGHALGLGHSPVREDALYPTSGATELTGRDRRTAADLYALPAGSVRE